MSVSIAHESYFSFDVGRPYPYRWLTPVVLTGGAIFTVLFVLLSYVTDGHEMVSAYETDYNATVDGGTWNYLPSLVSDKVRTSCDPALVPIYSDFHTNNSALLYRMNRVTVFADDPQQLDNTYTLVYSRNYLRNCTITGITLMLEHNVRQEITLALGSVAPVVRADVACYVDTEMGGATRLEMSAQSNMDDFHRITHDSYASIWWGESLLHANWERLARMTGLRNPADRIVGNGIINLVPDARAVTAGLGDAAFFSSVSQWVRDFNASSSSPSAVDNGAFAAGEGYRWQRSSPAAPMASLIEDARRNNSANMTRYWTTVDAFSKTFYSIVLADLGQQPSTSHPNLLTDAALLANFSAIYADPPGAWPYLDRSQFFTELANTTFDRLRDASGPLGITPSVLDARYLCQLPALKSTGTLIFSIVVSTIVLLQTAFGLFALLVGLYMDHFDRWTKPPSLLRSDECAGCGQLREQIMGEVRALVADASAGASQRRDSETAARTQAEEKGRHTYTLVNQHAGD